MSQIQPIVVHTRTFTPVRRDGNVVFYRDLVEQVPNLRPTLSISLAEPTKTSKLYKARIRMTVPVAELDVNGDPTGRVARMNSFEINTIYDAASTSGERLDIVSALQALSVKTEIEDVIEKLLPLY